MAEHDRRFRQIDERLSAIEATALERKANVDRLDAFFSLIGILSDKSQFAAAPDDFRRRATEAKAAEG